MMHSTSKQFLFMRFMYFIALSFVTVSVIAQPPTAEQMRQMIAGDVKQLAIAPQPVASVRDSVLRNGEANVRVRIYRPQASGSFPIVYFIHGGAYIAGDLNTHDNICRVLTNRLQAIVVAVDYRRPPEVKFPVPLQDAYAAFQWVAAHAKELGGNGQLMVIGDSAGGHLAADVCQMNAFEKTPVKLTAQVLVNPALDFRPGSPTDTTYGWVAPWLLAPGADRNDTYISPTLATNLSSQPPAVIIAGAEDEIRDDAIQYNQKLVAAGVVSNLYIQPKMGHLGALFCAAHPKAMPAVDFIVTTLQEKHNLR